MFRSIHVLAALICLFAISSCGKKAQKPYDLCEGIIRPPDEKLDAAGFVIRDSSGRNLLLTSSANRLDLSRLTVLQPCTDIVPKAEDREQNGIIWFTTQMTSTNGKPCDAIYLKWSDTDVDTLAYATLASTTSCYCTYSVHLPSLSFNGRKVLRDTAYPGRNNIYTLVK